MEAEADSTVPMESAISRLIPDVLEKIFVFLSYTDLKSAELTCTSWRSVVAERRMYWQLTKRIAMSRAPFQMNMVKTNKRTSFRAANWTGKKRRKTK
jgi:hypothetical protein